MAFSQTKLHLVNNYKNKSLFTNIIKVIFFLAIQFHVICYVCLPITAVQK